MLRLGQLVDQRALFGLGLLLGRRAPATQRMWNSVASAWRISPLSAR